MAKSPKGEFGSPVVSEAVVVEREPLAAPLHPSEARLATPVVGNPPKRVVKKANGNIVESY